MNAAETLRPLRAKAVQVQHDVLAAAGRFRRLTPEEVEARFARTAAIFASIPVPDSAVRVKVLRVQAYRAEQDLLCEAREIAHGLRSVEAALNRPLTDAARKQSARDALAAQVKRREKAQARIAARESAWDAADYPLPARAA